MLDLVLLEVDGEVANAAHVVRSGTHAQELLLHEVLLVEHLCGVGDTHVPVLERYLILTDEETMMMMVLLTMAPMDVLHRQQARL